MNDEASALEEELKTLEEEIESAKKEMDDRLEMRNEEETEFKKSLKDNADAIAILAQAIDFLSAMYKDNKIKLKLAQEPEYTVDPDKAPKTSWKDGNYGGKSRT